MQKWFSRFLLFSFLAMLSGLALAANGGDSLAPISAAAVNNHTDLSVAFLSEVFGTVNGSLHGTSGQMLGQLFYKLNQGITVVAALWLLYTIITILFKSAQEGSFMGSNRNVAVILLKIALGFGLLLPNPATGYSIFQDIVMKVVVKGVALADETWSYGLSYIQAGGSLWHRPEATSGAHDKSIVTQDQAKAFFGGKRSSGVIKSILQSEVCMIASNSIAASSQSKGGSGNPYYNNGSTQHFTPVYKNNQILFPGLGDSMSQSSPRACGSVTWAGRSNPIPGVHCKNNDSGKFNNCTFAAHATKLMVTDLMPAARQAFCSSSYGSGTAQCIGHVSSGVHQYIANDYMGALVDYVNGIMPVMQNARNGMAKAAKDFISNAQENGWILAGRYYWDLSQIQANREIVGNVVSYKPLGSNITKTSAYHNRTIKNILDNLAYGRYESLALNSLWNYRGAAGAGDTGRAYAGWQRDLAHGPLGWILTFLMLPFVADIISLIANFSTHGGPFGMGPDPIAFLHRVGMDCISIAGDIWIGLAIAIFGAAALTEFCQAVDNINTMVSDVSNWVRPMFMMLAALLLGVGVTLGYYVPLYPFLLFTFGVIGWIIAVIEAMVAAPLVCFGLTHPENHDFLGMAQQALMLLLGVFLRPVLMIIGLFSGMILSYVSLRIIVYTFSGFISDLFYVASPTPGFGVTHSVLLADGMLTAHLWLNAAISGSVSRMFGSILALPLVLIIFAALVYVVTNQCFSLIYSLPDNILRWIGGPSSPSAAKEMLAKVEGATSQFSRTAGEGANTTLRSAAKENRLQQGSQVDFNTEDGA